MAYSNSRVPGQSNLSDPAKRLAENTLIRRMRMRARMKSMGYPTGREDLAIRRLKKRTY